MQPFCISRFSPSIRPIHSDRVKQDCDKRKILLLLSLDRLEFRCLQGIFIIVNPFFLISRSQNSNKFISPGLTRCHLSLLTRQIKFPVQKDYHANCAEWEIREKYFFSRVDEGTDLHLRPLVFKSESQGDLGDCRPVRPNITPQKDTGTNYKPIYLKCLEKRLFCLPLEQDWWGCCSQHTSVSIFLL